MDKAVNAMIGFALALLVFGLGLLLVIYIVSPIDLVPGFIDDIVLAIVGFKGIGKLNDKRKSI